MSAVVDWRGQVVTMLDRAYLTQAMPMCVIWGTDDTVIPVRHAGVVAEIAPDATVEIIANAGHFPHKDHPQRFVKIVNDFIRTTRPAAYHRGRWRALLRPASRRRCPPEWPTSGPRTSPEPADAPGPVRCRAPDRGPELRALDRVGGFRTVGCAESAPAA